MNIRTKFWSASLLLVIALPLQSAANAEDLAAPEADAIGKAVEPADLEAYRGGETIVKDLNINDLYAYSSGNQVNGGTTGRNVIGPAFDGLNGIASVVQNSGNNVIIQGSTIINIDFVGAAQTP